MEKHFCNNCGNYGHLYRECRHPVLSYGIILFHKDKDNIFRIVLVERKDSISYIEFIRGKYKSVYNQDYLNLLFSRISNNEKQRLIKNDFLPLWNQLWIHTDTINTRIKKEFLKSSQNFHKLKNGVKNESNHYNIVTLVENIKTNYENNEWEIPKGRRKKYENNKDCAIREFKEETNISEDNYKLFNNIIPISEEYTGINNVKYKHVYYLGKSNELIDLFIDQSNRDQYTEIKNISWLTKEESLSHIRDHDKTKKELIINLFNFLENYETQIDVNL